MSKGVLAFHERYRLENLFEKDDMRPIFKTIVISKKRLWVTNGHGLVSLHLDDIPKEAVGTVITGEQLKYARRVAKTEKDKFLKFKYGFMDKNDKGEAIPYLAFMDGDKSPIVGYDKGTEWEFKKENVINWVGKFAGIIKDINNMPAQNHKRVAFSSVNIFDVLTAMGGNLRQRGYNNEQFIFTWHVKGNTNGVIVKSSTVSKEDEKEENLKRNIGVMMPVHFEDNQRK